MYKKKNLHRHVCHLCGRYIYIDCKLRERPVTCAMCLAKRIVGKEERK